MTTGELRNILFRIQNGAYDGDDVEVSYKEEGFIIIINIKSLNILLELKNIEGLNFRYLPKDYIADFITNHPIVISALRDRKIDKIIGGL
jgi:hypothetical protein